MDLRQFEPCHFGSLIRVMVGFGIIANIRVCSAYVLTYRFQCLISMPTHVIEDLYSVGCSI